ncbi:MAG: lipid A oxidase [Hyphomicrobiales bacterium]|nr:lipid A oxidase [Hyphomicrobiales bacterium]
MMRALAWGRLPRVLWPHESSDQAFDGLASLAAALMVCAVVAGPWLVEAAAPSEPPVVAAKELPPGAGPASAFGRDVVVSGYVSQPFYQRSNLRLTRGDGTDVELKQLGWDGDALYFPIDGGVRTVHGAGTLGFMVDFLHNKAVARLGRGAHGRKLTHPVIDEVAASGTIKGQPAPARLKLTDVFTRLEFTHGHNVLMFNPLVRLGSIVPGVRPYIGIGGGVAVPHVEAWFPGDTKEQRTNEYQFAGPAAQAVAGIEIRRGNVSYFVEYKFSYAWISGALTGDESWLNSNMPGDLWRQLGRWWRGEQPKIGRISTTLAAHQIAGGVGYVWRRQPAVP